MDVREAMAELTLRAHEIGAEAGNRMAGAMRDVIGAAAGFATFAIESARDLVQYMVRRGQMSQDEADRLLRDAEAAIAKRPRLEPPAPTPREQKAAAAASDRAPARPAPRTAGVPSDAPAAHETGRTPARSEPAKAEPAKAGRSKGHAAKAPPVKTAPVKTAPTKPAATKTAPAKAGAKGVAAAKPAAKSHVRAEKVATKPAKATTRAAPKSAGKSAARAPVKAAKSSAKAARPAKPAKPAPKKKR